MDQDPADEQKIFVISPVMAGRVLANIKTWLGSKPENDAEWLVMMTATREIREDFEALLAENG